MDMVDIGLYTGGEIVCIYWGGMLYIIWDIFVIYCVYVLIIVEIWYIGVYWVYMGGDWGDWGGYLWNIGGIFGGGRVEIWGYFGDCCDGWIDMRVY